MHTYVQPPLSGGARHGHGSLNMNAVDLENATKIFGKHVAVDNLSLAVPEARDVQPGPQPVAIEIALRPVGQPSESPTGIRLHAEQGE